MYIMTGKQSSPVSLSYGTFLTALVISSLVAISFSLPLIKRDTSPLDLDDIGAYFRIVVYEIGIEDVEETNLSMEVSNEKCVLFWLVQCNPSS